MTQSFDLTQLSDLALGFRQYCRHSAVDYCPSKLRAVQCVGVVNDLPRALSS